MADKVIPILLQTLKPIKIIKWKVNEGNSISIGCVFLLYEVDEDDKHGVCKLKSTQAGTVHKLLVQEGDVVKPGVQLLELQPCAHPTVMRDMCAECGADLRKEDAITLASVPMVHSVPELKVSLEQAQKIGKADVDRLLKDRKLVLLVDLDQTLIHTTNDNIPANIKDVYHFQLYGPQSPWYHTRLRPGTHKFLENMSPYFELHICTFGARNYAHMIAMFLDQDGKLFSQRILSRDECFNPTSKTANLKALFPCGDDLVCIIDDREDVWSHAANLIHVKPYHFFQHTGDINAPPGLDKHESDEKEGIDLSKVNCTKQKKIKANGIVNQEINNINNTEEENKETNNINEKNNTEQVDTEIEEMDVTEDADVKEDGNVNKETCTKTKEEMSTTVYEESDNEMKEEIASEMKEVTANESKEEINNEIKEDTATETKEEPVNESKKEPANEMKEEPTNETKEGPANETKEETTNETKEETTSETKDEATNITKEETTNEMKEESSNETKEEINNETNKETNVTKEETTNEMKEESSNETKEEINNETNKETANELQKNSPNDTKQEYEMKEESSNETKEETNETKKETANELQKNNPNDTKQEYEMKEESSNETKEETNETKKETANELQKNNSNGTKQESESTDKTDVNIEKNVKLSDSKVETELSLQNISNKEKEDSVMNEENSSIKNSENKVEEKSNEREKECNVDNNENNQLDDTNTIQNNGKLYSNNEKDNESKEDELIEIEDPDDYLIYLEDILKTIHKTFYENYDTSEGNVPDLKKVIPDVRRNVLKDINLVFSGLVPTHIKLEQSKAYQVARSLGANVSQDLQANSTHLVAVRPGTAKVNAGRRKRNLKIVTPDWLWACAERWTKVDERLYTLNNKGSKNRHPPPHCSSPEHIVNFEDIQDTTSRKRTPSGRFMDTINPLMSFSRDDIADMDREVEDIFNESESEGESLKKPVETDVDQAILEKLKKDKDSDEESSSSDESLTGEHPHGWRPNVNSLKRSREDQDLDDESTADEFPSTKFRRGEELSSDLDIGQDSNSEGSVDAPDEIDDGDWNMMGAALEREFLANN